MLLKRLFTRWRGEQQDSGSEAAPDQGTSEREATPPGLQQGYLALCAIMKNEAIGILEWIAYHRAVGVEKFFLYDHGSTDDTVARILPLCEAGIVELTHWTIRPGQLQAYHDFAHRHGEDWTWCAFIDLDEYINPFGVDSIPAFLAQFEDKAAVALQWLNFGPCGQDEPPKGLAIETYLTRFEDLHIVHSHVKTIVRMGCYGHPIGPHSFAVRSGEVVDENGVPVIYVGQEYGLQPPLLHEQICVNHYYTRSRSEWQIKLDRGLADAGEHAENGRNPDWLQLYEIQAIHRDERILKFASRTRAVLDEFRRLGAPVKQLEKAE